MATRVTKLSECAKTLISFLPRPPLLQTTRQHHIRAGASFHKGLVTGDALWRSHQDGILKLLTLSEKP